jgi:hypothetical protein
MALYSEGRKILKLTRNNYHSLEAEREYMSRSQYLNFLECEAKEMARLAGEWQTEKSESMLAGSYVHAWNEGRRDEFKKANPEMFTKQGELKANFKAADKMIAALESDPLCMYTLQGDKEVIMTAEFAGVTWKVMLDTYSHEKRRIVDLKTTKSIRERSWSEEHQSKVSFIEQYKYPRQAAIYCEIERIASGRGEYDWFDFYIVAVSKETCPDKEVIDMRDPERYVRELEAIKAVMPQILRVKSGEIPPIRCERCDYCRSTRKLKKAIHYSEL